MNETVSLRYELKSPIERVWHALTDPETLSKWMLFDTEDFQPVVGHQFQFRMGSDPDWTVIIDCEVLTVDEPNRLSYTWIANSGSHRTAVTWTLTQTIPGTTVLHFEQSGFHVDAKQEIGGAKSGWAHMLDQLRTLLAA